MDTITREAYTFSAAIVNFDAMPTCWVSKHYSVGLILLQCRNSRYKRVLDFNFATINRFGQPVDVVYNFVLFFMQPPNWLTSSIVSPRKMYTVWHRAVFRHVAFKSRPWNILFITLQNKSTLVTSATNVSQRKKSQGFSHHTVSCTFGTVRFWKLKKCGEI